MSSTDDEFALTPEQRAALDANEAALQDSGAEDWQPIFASHLDMRPIYAYVDDQDAVVDLRDPSRVQPWKGFCNKTAGSFREIVGARGGVRRQLIAKDWLEDAERITVKNFTFQPNAPRITRNLVGQRAVNTWSPPAIASVPLPEDWEERAALLTDHLAYLIPDNAERDNVHRWLAHIVQRPEELPGWHVLMIAENTFGTGRNWVSHAVACMLPEYTVEDLPLKRLLEGKHNSEIERAILGVVDEIHEGGKGQWDKEQELRSFLSAKKRTINPKFVKPYEIRNFLRVLMFSNHADALPLPEADRRHYVAQCTTTPRPRAYYVALYDALKDRRTLRSMYELLRTIDLTGFDIAGRAPESAAKTEMIAESRSDEETELRRIVKDWPHEVIRGSYVRAMLQAVRSADLMDMADDPQDKVLSTAALKKLYRVCGVKALGQVRMSSTGSDAERNENRPRVVALRNAAQWKRAGEEDARRAQVAASDETFKAWKQGHAAYAERLKFLADRQRLKVVP